MDSHPTDNWLAIQSPTGYNLFGQLTGQPRELVDGAATQHIADLLAMEFVEGQPPTHIWSGGSCPTDYNLFWQLTSQPWELVDGAATYR